MYEYSSDYYRHINRGARQSARAIVPIMQRYFAVGSVVDFGCGQGVWLAAWKEHGVDNVMGIDGDYVDCNSLLIREDEFLSHDLRQPIDLGRRFDVVESLEVAEHLPEECADVFVDCLTSHGELVMFSAAPTGQGGENHINEQSYDYWRDKFSGRGYRLFDFLRIAIRNNRQVKPWYRFNTLVFVHESRLKSLPAEIRPYRVSDDCRVPDISPIWYQLRKKLVAIMPTRVLTILARAKKQLTLIPKKLSN